MKKVDVEFYINLFKQKGKIENKNMETMKEVITKKISEEMKDTSQAEVTKEEINQALLAMKNDKAPVPDGFTEEFFKQNWEVVGDEVIKSLKFCFDQSYMYFPLNNTAITLVFKVENAQVMKDYRPHSLLQLLV